MSDQNEQLETVTGDVLSGILRGTSSIAGAPPAQRTPAATADHQTAAPPAEVPAPAAAAPVEPPAPVATPPQAPPAEEKPKSPYADVISSIVGDAPIAAKAEEWSEDAKALFKSVYGADDPVAYKGEIDKRIAEADLYKKQYEEVAPLKERIEKMPPAVARALSLALEGKTDEAQEYLKGLPKIAIEGKEAKALTDRQLIDTYLPGKITAEQWDAMNDPETDEDVVDALKMRASILRETAAERHDQERTKLAEELASREASKKQAFELYQSGVAEAVAHVKNSPLRLFADDNFVNEMSNGSFVYRFVKEDGVTPTPQAATLLLKALHFDNAVKDAEERGFERGQSKALQEATSRQRSVPRAITREGIPEGQAVVSEADALLGRILAGAT